MDLEAPFHDELALLLWVYGKAAHHGKEHIVEQSCSSHHQKQKK
jgi:hypothetical protein